MAEKVLFVDDEPSVLEGYERLLRREFQVNIAVGGERGLHAIREFGPYAVVVSDMRMPGMNGAEFLAQVRELQPETVRMLLTGHADMNAAIDAVNRGNILRFLTKPCEKEDLVEAINTGIAQYRTVIAEKDLLRKAKAAPQNKIDWDAKDICQWDNYEGPTGLPGPSQVRSYLAPLMGTDPQVYVVLFKFTALRTLEERYGEEAFGDYLNIEAQSLMQALRSDDRLFHWGRDVLMAVLRRQLSPAAMRMDVARLTSGSREHVIEMNGRKVMVASATIFDLLPVSGFASLEDMLLAFDPKLIGDH